MRLLSREDLRERGIRYSRQQLWRLIRDGKFPAPVRGAGKGLAWVEAEVDAHIEGLVAKRDATGGADGAA